MRPVTPQHTPLSFAEQRVLQVKSAQPELVGAGIASALSEGVGGALKGITAAFVGERERKDKEKESTLQRGHELALAKAKSEKTEEEKEYESLRLQNLRKTIEEKGGTIKPLNLAPSGVFSQPIPEEDRKVDFSVGDEDLLPLSSIPIPPQSSSTTKVTENIFEEPTKSTYAGFALTDEGRQLQKPLDQIYVPPEMSVMLASSGGGIPDVGGKDVLTAQTQASAMTPKTPGAIPATPQAMADFAAQAEQIRRNQIEEAIRRDKLAQGQPVDELMPAKESATISPPQYSASELLNMTYQSWEDAKKANEMLSKMYPNYNIKPIEQVEYQGNTYYELQSPEKKTAKEIAEEKKALTPQVGMSKDQIGVYDKLYANVQQNPLIKNAIDAKSSSDIILSSLSENNGFGDITAINAFQRMVDPGVAVREGDVTLLQSAIPRLKSLGLTVGNLIEGDKLTFQAREQLKQLAKKLANTRISSAQQSISDLREIAKDAGINPDRVIRELKVEIDPKEDLKNSARQLVEQIKQMPEGNDKEDLKAQLREIQIKLKK
jgi:hypothetical protein